MLSFLMRGGRANMATDRRTVATDALETLGTIIGPGERRDAIHLAVEPATAGCMLRPGEDVAIVEGEAVSAPQFGVKAVGIVDPFLEGVVAKGQRFWLVIYPRQITSLRHVWSHPDFPEEPAADAPDVAAIPGAAPSEEQRRASEAWLRDFIANADCPDYETLIAAATGRHELNTDPNEDDGYRHSSNDGEYLHFGGRDAHGEIPPEFWGHVECVTGIRIPKEQRAEYFSCSC